MQRTACGLYGLHVKMMYLFYAYSFVLYHYLLLITICFEFYRQTRLFCTTILIIDSFKHYLFNFKLSKNIKIKITKKLFNILFVIMF